MRNQKIGAFKWVAFGVVWLCLNFPLFAQEPVSIPLNLPQEFFAKTCPVPVWNGLELNLQKVEDKRPYQALGVVTKRKGKDPVSLVSRLPLTDVLRENMVKLLSDCGMKITQDQLGAKNQLSVEINDFIATEEKRFITGKGDAKSRLTLTVRQPGKTTAASVGYEMEFKLTRKRGVERLTEILNELFENTLKQIPKAPQLRQL